MRFSKLTWLLAWALTGCSQAPSPQTTPELGMDAGGLDAAPIERGRDTGSPPDDAASRDAHETGKGGDTGDADGTPPRCRELSQQECLHAPSCVWNDAFCESVEEGGSPFASSYLVEAPGVAIVDGEEGPREQDVRLWLVRSGEGLHGRLSFGDGAVHHRVRGNFTPFASTFTLAISGAECPDGCENPLPSEWQKVALFEVKVRFDGLDLLFATPTPLVSEFDGELPFLNLRFQPNDGIKPVSVPDTSASFAGQVVLFEEPFLDAREDSRCTLVFSGETLAQARPETLECETFAIGTDGATRIDPDSFAYDEDTTRFWFVIESPDGRLTLLGRQERGLVHGVVARDDGSYYAASATPIGVGDVAMGDVVALFTLFAE